MPRSLQHKKKLDYYYIIALYKTIFNSMEMIKVKTVKNKLMIKFPSRTTVIYHTHNFHINNIHSLLVLFCQRPSAEA